MDSKSNDTTVVLERSLWPRQRILKRRICRAIQHRTRQSRGQTPNFRCQALPRKDRQRDFVNDLQIGKYHSTLRSHAAGEEAQSGAPRQEDSNSARRRMFLVVRRGLFKNEVEDAAGAKFDKTTIMNETVEVLRSVAGHLEDSLREISNPPDEQHDETPEAPRRETQSFSIVEETAGVHHGGGHQHAVLSDEAEECFPAYNLPQSSRPSRPAAYRPQQDSLGRILWMCPGLPGGRSGFYISCPRKKCFSIGFGGFIDLSTHLREHHSSTQNQMVEILESQRLIFTISVEVVRRREQENLLVGIQPWTCFLGDCCGKSFQNYSRVRWHYSRVHHCRIEPLPRESGNWLRVNLV